ncbi:MAG: hypothetical protein VKM92_06560 [Cyanobacteriota bacterium]|nr:hypothetical protein [Cyanobacteriota bacterium]
MPLITSLNRGQGQLLAAATLLAPVVLASGSLLLSAEVRAQQTSKLDPKTFPPTQLFRELQLTTVACGRENAAEPCDKARAMADPLMDHPKLPASCKDTVWNIRERAVVAGKNTYERREALNRDSTDLIALCKPATKPLGSGAQQPQQDEKKPGGLGGFLRGLGLGGSQDKR